MGILKTLRGKIYDAVSKPLCEECKSKDTWSPSECRAFGCKEAYERATDAIVNIFLETCEELLMDRATADIKKTLISASVCPHADEGVLKVDKNGKTYCSQRRVCQFKQRQIEFLSESLANLDLFGIIHVLAGIISPEDIRRGVETISKDMVCQSFSKDERGTNE